MGGEDEFSSLQLQGGDMTREVYRWAEDAEANARPGGRGKRSKSWHTSLPDPENEDLDAGSIKKPGGFRRDYLRRRAPSSSERMLKSTGSGLRNWSARVPKAPKTLTKNFYEFLSMYGHFAGGDLEEDDEDYMSAALDYGTQDGDDDDGDSGERSALLTPGTPGRRKQTLKERGATGDNTPGAAAGLLIKSFVGTGVLFLPKAYLNGGMLFSNLVLLSVAALSYYCFILLVNTGLKVEGSFGDIGGSLYGKWMRYLILGSVSLSQAGFVAAYIVFTSENMQAFVLAVSKCRDFIDIKWWILIQALIFLPLSLYRDISKLGGTALIADGFIVIGLVYLAVYDIRTIAINGHADIVRFNASNWTSFIGTAIFTFEGVGLIIPIQQSMKDPSRFPPVLAGVMCLITFVFISIGALSYAAFGPATRTVVLLNLPQDSKFVNAVQLLYSLAILLSTPLQLFPAIRIMETGTFSRSGKFNPYIKWKKNAFRFVVVIGCALLAWVGADDLDKFVSVVGTFACIPLVYVYPAALHYKAVATTKRQKAFDILLGICGIFAMGYTTALTVRGWIEGSGGKTPGYCDE
ncbi:solute carrier family 36 (proton-coupled amino acid transporter), partial [Lecanoromycetidae sp. Uapishka_2]